MRMVRSVLSVLLLCGATTLRAESTAPAASAADERVVWHVVRPGDTLEGLSERYLGSSDRWQENWKLNPQLANPHRIEPGERLRLKVAAGSGAPDAVLERKSNNVDDKLGPLTWTDAIENDLLLDRDGVRTSTLSSAELAFSDGARLLVTEDSLIFLRQAGKKLTAETPRGVEIQQGVADVETTGAAVPTADVEIVLGSAHATSLLREHRDGQSRARRGTDGPSAFMVYRGEGAVEAAGTRVALPQGTGSALPAGGPPTPAETLLAMPSVLEPAADATLSCASPPVRWSALPGAATYSVDLCRDRDCASLVQHVDGIAGTDWSAANLAPGDYVVRVRARSASGLDGYPAVRAFHVGEAAAGATAAAASAGFAISGTGVSGERGDTLWIDGRSQLQAVSPTGGLPAGAALELDGKPAAVEAWRGPWSPGVHTAGATIPGPCGAPLKLATVRFAVDTEPPAIRWEVANLPPSSAQTEAKEEQQRRRFPPPFRWPAPVQLEYSLDGETWVPYSWGVPEPWQRGPHLPPAVWHSTIDDPENPGRLREPVDEAVLYLRAPQSNPFRAGAPVEISGWQALAVHVTDGGSGVSRIDPRPVEVSSGNWVLRIEVADLVGNRQIVDWPIAPKTIK